ncbi:MAG: hypothetical protein JW810_04955 [Sedimentisphaerales bacterium]|nr:hypothetical protein [Sedimentisphaerales bacterium]
MPLLVTVSIFIGTIIILWLVGLPAFMPDLPDGCGAGKEDKVDYKWDSQQSE